MIRVVPDEIKWKGNEAEIPLISRKNFMVYLSLLTHGFLFSFSWLLSTLMFYKYEEPLPVIPRVYNFLV